LPVESLDPAEDGHIQQLWSAEAQRRLDDVRAGRVQTIPGDEALERVRRIVQVIENSFGATNIPRLFTAP
jgi:hypothetical protein